MNKVLIICGPTAVGKTSLALELAKKFNGELLSADSRQVYKGMDIITGKDLPKDGTKIYLTDLVFPNQDFNIAQWRKEALKVIEKLHSENKLPIVVGGTGFYIKALIGNIETINIPQNKNLRKQLKGKTVLKLFEILTGINPVKAAQMNQSDKNNPRRLVRAIEVAQSTHDNSPENLPDFEYLIIGLSAPLEVLLNKIDDRVVERVKSGAVNEVENLLKIGLSWDTQSMSAVGYKQFRDYFEKNSSLKEIVDRWKKAEHQYAKKQLTWFKKHKDINWFDVTDCDWKYKVEKLVQTWYN